VVVISSFAGGDRPDCVVIPVDLAIRRLAPNGEALLPVKTALNFGHAGRWRCLRVETLLKALLVQSSSTRPGCSGGKPQIWVTRIG
jgi:hypothetical protein